MGPLLRNCPKRGVSKTFFKNFGDFEDTCTQIILIPLISFNCTIKNLNYDPSWPAVQWQKPPIIAFPPEQPWGHGPYPPQFSRDQYHENTRDAETSDCSCFPINLPRDIIP